MATDLITLAEGAVISQFLSPFGKALGEAMLNRAQQLGKRAMGYLKNVGREPRPVEPKLLFPLVQAAALETDPGLSEQWAALLANFADPAQRVELQPGFAEVLRQLTPTDARVADFIYHAQPPFSVSPVRPTPVIMGEIIVSLEIPPAPVALSVDNLLRLRLCERQTGTFDGGSAPTTLSASYAVMPTIFGLEFVAACTPPKP